MPVPVAPDKYSSLGFVDVVRSPAGADGGIDASGPDVVAQVKFCKLQGLQTLVANMSDEQQLLLIDEQVLAVTDSVKPNMPTMVARGENVHLMTATTMATMRADQETVFGPMCLLLGVEPAAMGL